MYETREWADPTGSPGNNDARTVIVYDQDSRVLTRKVLLSGTDASPTWAVTSYVYDNAGRLITQTRPEGGTTVYAYDRRARVVTKWDPAGNTTRYLYYKNNPKPGAIIDAAGNYDICTYWYGNLTNRGRHNSTGTLLSREYYKYYSFSTVRD